MSSSISISELAPIARRSWGRVLRLYCVSVVLLGCVAAVLLLTLDPFDTGRFALFGGHGVPHYGQRLISASLGRQADRDAAVLGNSTLQLLDPERLGLQTGLRVVSLTIPGTVPPEQLAVADWFRRHHPGAAFKGLVLGIDSSWCRGDGRMEPISPFPYWLYAENPLDYALGMMRLKHLETAGRKLLLMRGRVAPTRADGYNDYELGRTWTAFKDERHEFEAEHGRAAVGDTWPPRFAALPLLRQFLAQLPAETRVVLVMPPRNWRVLPAPGTREAARDTACAAAFGALAAERRGSRLLNFVGRPGMREDDAFWDTIHFRASVARAMEAEIAAALVAKLGESSAMSP